MHIAARQQRKRARTDQGREIHPAHGGAVRDDIASLDGAYPGIEVDQHDHRQDVYKAERSNLTNVVNPKAGQRNQPQQGHPDISDDPVLGRAFGQKQLHRPQDKRGKSGKSMCCYDEPGLIEWSE